MTDPDITAPQGEPSNSELQHKLRALQDLLAGAKAMPMSASCVVNRGEALALVEAAIAAVPEEASPPPGNSEADAILADAEQRAATMVSDSSVVARATAEAERIVAEATEEAEGLRTETDGFVDQRMASFESVLHKTLSQVQLARARLSQRSGLDESEE